MKHDDDGSDRTGRVDSQWWYLPVVVVLVGFMGFVVLWLLPSMG